MVRGSCNACRRYFACGRRCVCRGDPAKEGIRPSGITLPERVKEWAAG